MMSHDITWCHRHDRGVGCVIQGGSVMESYQFEILDQYFSFIVTIPHISIKSQSLCIPTYFSVYFKPREVIIMHKIHKYLKYLKTFLSSRWQHPSSWCHTIMASTQSNFRIGLYEVGEMGLDIPHQPGPVTAPRHSPTASQQLSLCPTFNLISINYANVWLHTLNVVVLIWIV